MRLFRRSFDVTQARPRLAADSDLERVARLLRDGVRRFYAMNAADLPGLLRDGRAVVLEADNEIGAVVVLSRELDRSAWLRGLALTDGINYEPTVDMLLGYLHQTMQASDLCRIYYAGDDSAEPWLNPLLLRRGYQRSTEVVVYEKRKLDCPAVGNQSVTIRPATGADLPLVLHLDRSCFEAQWTKDESILGPAINQGHFFVLAEMYHTVVGYAYATAHFGGRLVHLVRIAVTPGLRGHGVGVRLMAELVGYAIDQSATAITLNTQAYNVQAQRLYCWFGFQPTGERQIVLHYDL
jgi:[ribosomal protein S18]-alanine N-acetyltransferase